MRRGLWLRRRRLTPLLVTLAVVMVVFAADRPTPPLPYTLIAGPSARLLAQAVDLGPARTERVQLTAELQAPTEPVALSRWATSHGLAGRGRDGGPRAGVGGGAGA